MAEDDSLRFVSPSARADTLTGDPRFYQRAGPHSLDTVARCAIAEAPKEALLLEGVAALQRAGPKDVSFIDNKRYRPFLTQTRAGAVIVHPDLRAWVPSSAAAIVTLEPYAAWARVCSLFHPQIPPSAEIHPSAYVDSRASVDASVRIDAFAVVEAGAAIGPRCQIGAGSVIGQHVVLGSDCRVGAHATISHALVRDRVYIYPGARIGQEGFGFASTATGFLTVPQLGRVIIEDDVEIGANTTVDRGSVQDTVIGKGSRLDNLVQIGHNVVIGRYCIVVAQVGIAGSVVVEDFARIGGQAAIAGHIRVGSRAQIGAQAGVISDVKPGEKLLGSPARPRTEFLRQVARGRQFLRRP